MNAHPSLVSDTQSPPSTYCASHMIEHRSPSIEAISSSTNNLVNAFTDTIMTTPCCNGDIGINSNATVDTTYSGLHNIYFVVSPQSSI